VHVDQSQLDAPQLEPVVTHRAVQHDLIKLLQDNEVQEEAIVCLAGEVPGTHLVDLRDFGRRGASVLWYAANRGFAKAAEVLLEKHVDPNTQDHAQGRTPLWEAAWFGHVALASLLLQWQADPDICPRSGPSCGVTPLAIALKRGRHDMVRHLCGEGPQQFDTPPTTTVVGHAVDSVQKDNPEDDGLHHRRPSAPHRSRHQRERAKKWKSTVQVPTPDPSD